MLGVAGRVYQLERAVAELNAFAVRDYAHALRRDGQQLSVQALEGFIAVHASDPRDELRRIDHMRRATGVQQRTGVRQLAHQEARSARMIEVDVGEEQVIHGGWRDAELREGREQVGNTCVGTDIHEDRATLVLDHVRGRMTGIEILSIDRGDAVRMAIERRSHGNSRLEARRVSSCTRTHPTRYITPDA